MKTETEVSKHWDDLVFENRNKEYGAYAVRKSYSDRVIVALFVAMSATAMVFAIPAINSLFPHAAIPTPTIPREHKPFEFIDPEIVIQQKIDHFAKAVKHIAALVPKVVTGQVSDEIKPVNQSTAANSTEGSVDGKEVPTEGDGLGVEIAEQPVAAKVEPSKPFLHVQVMPVFNGGQEAMFKYIQKKLRYPASARRIGVDGIVYVSFVIDGNGNVVDVNVIKGIDHDCDAEAVRVISSMPQWTGGRQNEMPVSVKMVLPIKFKLES